MRALLRTAGRPLLPALLVLAVCVLVAGCGPVKTKPELPAATLPVHTETVRQVYVPIKPELTVDCEVPEGPIAQVLSVASERRLALEECTARMRQIRAIQGTPVEP